MAYRGSQRHPSRVRLPPELARRSTGLQRLPSVAVAASMRGVCHLCDIRQAPNPVHQGPLMDVEATSPTPEPAEVGRTTVLTFDEMPHPTLCRPCTYLMTGKQLFNVDTRGNHVRLREALLKVRACPNRKDPDRPQ